MGVRYKFLTINLTPGVGTYETHSPSSIAPKFSFQQGKRIGLENQNQTPSPFSYTPVIAAIKKRSANAVIPRTLARSSSGLAGAVVGRNGLQPFITKSLVTLPGPGAYEIPPAFNIQPSYLRR